MKKNVGVKRSLQHLKSSSSCVTSQNMFDKYNPDMTIYYDDTKIHEVLWHKRTKSSIKLMKLLREFEKHIKVHMTIISTPYIKPLFDKKGNVKKTGRKR